MSDDLEKSFAAKDDQLREVVKAIAMENPAALRQALSPVETRKQDVLALRDKKGRSLLHYTAMMTDPDCTGKLLTFGFDPQVKDQCGDKPFDLALDWGCDQTARVLKEAMDTADTPAFTHKTLAAYQKDEKTDFPLHRAARDGVFQPLVKTALAASERVTFADMMQPDDRGDTVPDIMVRYGRAPDMFMPELWTGRLTDLEKLWAMMPQSVRDHVDYDALSARARKVSMRRNVPKRPSP